VELKLEGVDRLLPHKVEVVEVELQHRYLFQCLQHLRVRRQDRHQCHLRRQ
jgi:hypothetical protein